MKNDKSHPFRLGLVSMPWSIFNRPSIQLAALKAYLDANSTIATTLFHPYLAAAASIGTETYHYLAKNSWAGEALYSPLLFPEQSRQAEQLFYESCREETALSRLNFQETSQILELCLDQWISSVNFEKYDLIGFSICFNQLLSSLTAAARIKKQFPDLPIVIGGQAVWTESGSPSCITFIRLIMSSMEKGKGLLWHSVISLLIPTRKRAAAPGCQQKNEEHRAGCMRWNNGSEHPARTRLRPLFSGNAQLFPGTAFYSHPPPGILKRLLVEQMYLLQSESAVAGVPLENSGHRAGRSPAAVHPSPLSGFLFYG